MQKLSVKLKNAPRSASPAPSSASRGLNREDTLSAQDEKLADNISEETQRSGKSEQDLRVPVLNMRGEALMPTKPAKARKLLEQGKAEVVQRTPFTIQLTYPTGENKQDITLGVDAGYSTIGFSAVTNREELLVGELELRDDIPRLLKKRRMYRRNRRSRLWYREPRFNNRGKEGWLAPSIRHKLNSHIKLTKKLKKLLPITRIVIEVAKFDIQKMQNPEIEGVEYQQGELQGYEVKEYLLEKFDNECVYCGNSDVPLEVEHIVPRSRGGSDRVSNLTIACTNCNQEKGNKTAEEFGHSEVQEQAKEPLKAAAFMNIVRWQLVDRLSCEWTYGYITKFKRSELDLNKSHVNDAFVIASGATQKRANFQLGEKQVRRQNRSLYKANPLEGGYWKRNTRHEVEGFRRFDKVKYKDKECFISALRKRGSFRLKNFDREIICGSKTHNKLELLERANGVIQEVKACPSAP